WLQNDWMALNKCKKTLPCLVHVLIYTSSFLILTRSWEALLFIGGTHFVFDRFHSIIKQLIYCKNSVFYILFTDKIYPMYELCDSTGFYDDAPNRTFSIYNKKLSEKEIEMVKH